MRPSFDEMQATAKTVREHYRGYDAWLAKQPSDVMLSRREEAEMIFRRVGITFAVYGAKDEDGSGTERLIPFDLIPRVIPAHEWAEMEKGLAQRVAALNRFIHDVYHGQEIIQAGIVPAEQIFKNAQFRPEMMGVDVPGGVYSHISGIDIVRAANPDGSGSYYVLEDNLRVPSGVSYMLEDRKMMMRLFPEVFAKQRIAPVDHYPNLLLKTMNYPDSADVAGVCDPGKPSLSLRAIRQSGVTDRRLHRHRLHVRPDARGMQYAAHAGARAPARPGRGTKAAGRRHSFSGLDDPARIQA